jgi:hypothetical protein
MTRSGVFVAATVLLWASIPVASAQVKPVGPEFQVNTYTTDFQIYPSVAAAPSGQFVVVWASYDQDLSYGGIFGQRYDSDGTRLGSEFQVNTFTEEDQYFPAVTADAAGDFVVVWASYFQDGDEFGVFGQRFAADGTPAGGEFQVNTYAYGYQGFPAVASAPDGAFLVVWMSTEQDGNDFGVFGQRYDTNGDPAGAEFLVNTHVNDYQGGPNVAADGNGNFVVVWNSFDQDGNGYGIFGQKLNGTGGIVGPEFQVNTFTQDDQLAPAVAADARGNFVVAWQSNFQDASDSSVFAQRFNASGTRLGSEFRVHAESVDGRSTPSLAADPNGNFVVAWTADDPVSGQDVFGRHFDSSGSPTGAEFQVNTYTTASQSYQAVAADAHGNFAVVWSSFGQDGDGFGVFGRRLSAEAGPTACPGDCNSNGQVTVDELVKGVNIALGNLPVGDCPAFDTNDNNEVTVDELIKAVNAALSGCPS